MKKIITVALLMAISLVSIAQTVGEGKSPSIIGDTVTTTNGTVFYMGIAYAYDQQASPSTNKPVWRITRTIYDKNGRFLESKSAFGIKRGDDALTSNYWTNRYNATYK